MEKLSSDDLAHFRAAVKARAAADAIWGNCISVLIPKYNLTQSDSISDDDGIITRAAPQSPLQTVQPDETS